ncbi:potassium channel family protein [Pectinatus cerevisiiphilus]|uniref:Voltage-gated potassium channel n=1 Tax=Pectinatus cerevisiiphilus TaxID=86956 RepID=A0A4V2URH5_9FIRM|nr:potassium channel family protein [Pectinatus cerevisiiphilus]TCS77272.1 voltage-gated potassium channel [Pectinatus cerevisiiphilus]
MIIKLRRFIKSLSKYMLAYNIMMAILSVSVIFTLILETRLVLPDIDLDIIDYFGDVVWWVFFIDYMVRLAIAENRILFIRSNVVDLIAIIPFGTLFQGFRAIKIIRLLYMFRAFAYLNRVYGRIEAVIKTNDFDHILWFTLCVIFIGAISISFIDDMDIGDALWWSFVTTTTVGYGDIAPHSTGGRLIAVFLMIIGIGFLSTLTGTISAFFMHHFHANKKVTFKDEEVGRIINRLNDFDTLSNDDLNKMFDVLKALKGNV